LLYNRHDFLKKGNKHNMLRKLLKFAQRALVAATLLAAMSPIAGAATPDGLSNEQAAALVQRVEGRWQTLTDRDYGKTWEYSTPLYRGIFSKDLYALQFSYAVERWLTGVEVTNYDAAAAVASVTARVMSKPLKQTSTASVAMGALPVSAREKWILIDGQWWFSAND
jgi:hypothetical protein